MSVGEVFVTLIGPGGAGKSTIGALIAERLAMPFVDLDRRFRSRAGDIGEFIDQCGYAAYARENVETCAAVLKERTPCVAALSSLRAQKIETMRPLTAVVNDLLGRLDESLLTTAVTAREEGFSGGSDSPCR